MGTNFQGADHGFRGTTIERTASRSRMSSQQLKLQTEESTHGNLGSILLQVIENCKENGRYSIISKYSKHADIGCGIIVNIIKGNQRF